MTQPRRALGIRILGGIFVFVGALLTSCSILFYFAFGTGENGEIWTV